MTTELWILTIAANAVASKNSVTFTAHFRK
jgi:hypothetical protein